MQSHCDLSESHVSEELSLENNQSTTTESEYEYAKKKLGNLGYNNQQCHRIISRLHYKKAFNTLCELHHQLIALQPPLTHADLTNIAAHSGGSKNLNSIKEYYAVLLNLGFTKEQILKLVCRDSGSHNIVAVKIHYETLTTFDFTNFEMTQIASHLSGSNNVESVISHFDALQKLGVTKKQIIHIASHNYASSSIESTLKYMTLANNNNIHTITTDAIIAHLSTGRKGRAWLADFFQKTIHDTSVQPAIAISNPVKYRRDQFNDEENQSREIKKTKPNNEAPSMPQLESDIMQNGMLSQSFINNLNTTVSNVLAWQSLNDNIATPQQVVENDNNLLSDDPFAHIGPYQAKEKVSDIFASFFYSSNHSNDNEVTENENVLNSFFNF